MINEPLKKNKKNDKEHIFQETAFLIKNRNELFKNKIKINISIKNNINTKKTNLENQKITNCLQILKNKNIMSILKKKIQKIDPWYAELCKLKKLPKVAQQLAINTSYKNGLEHWYIYLKNQKKCLIQFNAWKILKKELSTITNKKIQLIIENNHIINTLTPYEWFEKIYEESILKEYILIIKDPNIQELKKKFNIEFYKNNIKFI